MFFLLIIFLAIGLMIFPSYIEDINSSCSAVDRLIAREYIHELTLGYVDVRKLPKTIKDIGFGLLHGITGVSVADKMLEKFKEDHKIKRVVKDSDGKYSLEDELQCTLVYYSLALSALENKAKRRNEDEKGNK